MALKIKWPKLFEREIPIYGGRVVFVPSIDKWKECASFLIGGENFEIPNGSGAHQQFLSEKESVYLVGVFDKSRRTLVHEIAHCSFRVLWHAGVEVSPDGRNEAYCYLLDTLYEILEPGLRAKR
ncbi:hypothetical protein [Robbsia andropogonis]|uniref:hypothetical protein n=1 Tax=Robbsia andropogonis TaxID=28092 RepID=UPI0012FB7CD1|nr:hypothetical protein [Robbsia andropogonis]